MKFQRNSQSSDLPSRSVDRYSGNFVVKFTHLFAVLPVFIFLRAPGGVLAPANLKFEGARLKIQSATHYHPIFMSFLDLLDQKIKEFFKIFSKFSHFLSKISEFGPFSHKRQKCLRAPGATSGSSGATPKSESAKMAPKRQYWQHCLFVLNLNVNKNFARLSFKFYSVRILL